MNSISDDHKEHPNFLIIGAAKCGTTSLYHYLNQHRDVFMPEWKEPSFFADNAVGGIQDLVEYKALFNAAPEQCVATGEASVAYLYDKNAALKIKDTLGGDTKIIVLLRNPIDMAYSLWGHMKRVGAEDNSFDVGIKNADQYVAASHGGRFKNEWLGNFLYLQRALYTQQLKAYYDVLDANNIHVFIYEEFFADTEASVNSVFDLLNVSNDCDICLEKKNVSGSVRSGAVQGFLRNPSFVKNILKAIVPSGVLAGLKKRVSEFNRVQKALDPMSAELRKELEGYFNDDVRALEQMLGRSLKEVWF